MHLFTPVFTPSPFFWAMPDPESFKKSLRHRDKYHPSADRCPLYPQKRTSELARVTLGVIPEGGRSSPER
jgi:hypothetical protein